jgi:hypothetical protein
MLWKHFHKGCGNGTDRLWKRQGGCENAETGCVDCADCLSEDQANVGLFCLGVALRAPLSTPFEPLFDAVLAEQVAALERGHLVRPGGAPAFEADAAQLLIVLVFFCVARLEHAKQNKIETNGTSTGLADDTNRERVELAYHKFLSF